jgi:hypothetical protein
MTTSLTSPEAIVNAALVRIGYERRIGSMFEGSAASKAALDIYGETRDQLLRDQDFGFAERNASLTAVKQAPANGYPPGVPWTSAYPPQPYFYEYIYPSDALKIRAVKPQVALVPNFSPQPNVFTDANDPTLVPPSKVILCYVGPTMLVVYTGRVTDPTEWDSSFTEAMIASLADRLEAMLSSEKSTQQAEAADELHEIQQARVTQG